MQHTFITKKVISSEQLKEAVAHPECGGICTFEGVVRNHHEGRRVIRLFYEAYELMAEKVLTQLKSEIENEWPGCHASVMHRHGELNIGDVAVAIVVWAPHRREAFAACEAMINRIKECVPIWKQEFYADGSVKWVRCHHGDS